MEQELQLLLIKPKKCTFIRSTVADHYNDDVAATSILYGGSCKPENAVEIFSKPDVDGGLIGGAALDANSFMKIIHLLDELCRVKIILFDQLNRGLLIHELGELGYDSFQEFRVSVLLLLKTFMMNLINKL